MSQYTVLVLLYNAFFSTLNSFRLFSSQLLLFTKYLLILFNAERGIMTIMPSCQQTLNHRGVMIGESVSIEVNEHENKSSNNLCKLYHILPFTAASLATTNLGKTCKISVHCIIAEARTRYQSVNQPKQTCSKWVNTFRWYCVLFSQVRVVGVLGWLIAGSIHFTMKWVWVTNNRSCGTTKFELVGSKCNGNSSAGLLLQHSHTSLKNIKLNILSSNSECYCRHFSVYSISWCWTNS